MRSPRSFHSLAMTKEKMSLREKRSNPYNLVMSTKQYYVYIATNKINTVLYTGVTNDLIKRMYQHKNKMVAGFTSKYNINKLVYFEVYIDITEAIKREKQIKGGSRQKKINLIKKVNPTFKDLYEDIIK